MEELNRTANSLAGIVGDVGLWRWFLGMLMRGTPPALDPDESVEVATLPLFDAALLAERLRNRGLDASCTETYNVATRTLANGRVSVPRRQLDAARVAATTT